MKYIYLFIICLLIGISVAMHENKNTSGKDHFKLKETIGVSIHELEWKNTDFSLIKTYGNTIVRDALVWEIIEKEKGTYNFNNNGIINYDNFLNKFKDNNVRPFLMLIYTNSLYNDHRALDNEYIKKAYANWVAACAYRYKNRNIVWEIYNEPNGGFWLPQSDSAYHYVDVVKRTAPFIKQNDPSGTVVAPALAEINNDSLIWLEETFKLGILDYIDAISVHPYRTENPETVIEDYKKIRLLISKYTKKNIAIFSSEWGYSDVPNWNNEGSDKIVSSELKQAQYITRMLLVNHSQQIAHSIIYDWKDDGEDNTFTEHHFGLFNFDGKSPKKSGVALNILSDTLGNYMYSKRIDIGDNNDYLFEYTTDNSKIAYAFWTTKEDHYFTFKGKHKGEIINMLGEKSTIKGKDMTLSITESPNYILLD